MNYIEKFQKENKLKVDGSIGINTLLKMKQMFNLQTDEETAHLIGQLSHETVGFTKDTENLRYSAERLLVVFKKYFPTDDMAKAYAYKPEKIANRVYANRMGNGNEASGMGWKYKGRYSVHTTGYSNYKAFSDAMRNPAIVSDPDSTIVEYFWKAGLYFFHQNNLFSLTKIVDYNAVRKLTKRINGGYNGLKERYDLTMKFYSILKKK
jgi:putative chitinase